MELNEDLAELVGAFIGDGCMSLHKRKDRKNVVIYSIIWAGDKRYDEVYFKTRLIPLLKKYFPQINYSLRACTNGNSMYLRSYAKELYDFFYNLGFRPGPKSHSVIIPSNLYDSLLCKFIIRGIYDTDGCVFLDKRKAYRTPYPRINLQMASQELMIQVKEYMQNDFKVYFRKGTRRNGNEAWYLEIYGHEQAKRFLNEIGFSNPRHLSKLALVAQR